MGQGKSKKDLTDSDVDFLKENTCYDEYTIRKWWLDFETECPDGEMTPKKMSEMCRMIFPDLNMDDLGEHLVRLFDTDKDGVVDFREFLVGLSTATTGSNRDKLKSVFRLYDVDGDKEIDLQEMIQIMKASHVALYCDAENIEEKAKEMFRTMDHNKDGKITEKEFIDTITGAKVSDKLEEKA